MTVPKFALLFLGCFLLTTALVPLIMWANLSALVNFNQKAMVEVMPQMASLIARNLLYSLEMALGLWFIKKALG